MVGPGGVAISSLRPICNPSFSFFVWVGLEKKKKKTKLGCEKYVARIT
jgi:hypothetical protein